MSESNSGVTLASPDGRYSAFLASVMRAKGSRTPFDFLRWALNAAGYTDVRIISGNQMPPQRMSYQVWQSVEFTCSYAVRGMPVTAVITSAVANYYGMNDAVVAGYQATDADFQNVRSVLSQISKSIILTNAAQASGNDTVIHPKNNPMGDTVMKAYEYRQKVTDKTARDADNAIRGTIDLYDPSTGQTFNAPNQHNYYWRQPGTNNVVGTDAYTSPGIGYQPLQAPPSQGR